MFRLKGDLFILFSKQSPRIRDSSTPPKLISPVPSGTPVSPNGLINTPNIDLPIRPSETRVSTKVGVELKPDTSPALLPEGPRPTMIKFDNKN